MQVLARKNGSGRLSEPERIVASSVPGLLEQAATRLDLPQAARRVYMADGTLVLEADDIVAWARDNDVTNARRQLRAEKRKQREAQAQQKTAQNGDGQKGVTSGVQQFVIAHTFSKQLNESYRRSQQLHNNYKNQLYTYNSFFGCL